MLTPPPMPTQTQLNLRSQWHADHAQYFSHQLKSTSIVPLTQRTYVYDPTYTSTSVRSFLRPLTHPLPFRPIPSPKCALCTFSLHISDGEPLQATPCNHIFHYSCIAAHLGTSQHALSNSCPSCHLNFKRVLRPVWYAPVYGTHVRTTVSAKVVTTTLTHVQRDGYVPFWWEVGVLEFELRCERAREILPRLRSRDDERWVLEDLGEDDERERLWEVLEKPNPFLSFGRVVRFAYL